MANPRSQQKSLPVVPELQDSAPGSRDTTPSQEKQEFISVHSVPSSIREKPSKRERSIWSRLQLRPSSSDTHSRDTWKPATFSGPILSCFVIFSVCVIVLLEILSRKAAEPSNGGGLVFAVDIESFQLSSTFIFLYLPIVIAVIYSMLWSWIDLDAKRLEPWLQLSKEGGSNAEDSLLLQYPFDFLPLVPFSALRRRHWGVFYSGTIMLVIFWVITPLQPAIFNTGIVKRTFVGKISDVGSLVPLPSQLRLMNSNILNRAYGMSWLEQQPPPFTTTEFATLPFRPTNSSTSLPSATWENTVHAYSTNLTCKSIPAVYNETTGYIFDNEEGCTSSFGIPEASTEKSYSRYLLMYIGWHSDAHVSYSFGNPKCNERFSNQYLVIYANGETKISPQTYGDFQLMFCTPTYTVREMVVTVNATTGAILTHRATGNIINQPVDEKFNTTLFEYIMSAGVNPHLGQTRSLVRDADYPDIQDRIEQYPRVAEMGLIWPLTNMVGFAAGLNKLPVRDLGDPEILRLLFQKTHQVLFTAAFSLLTSQNVTSDSMPVRGGLITDSPAAIVLVRPIAIIVEVAFAVVALLVAAFWLTNSRRKSNLSSDPASIAKIMSLVPGENSLTTSLRDSGNTTTANLGQAMYRRKYRLIASSGGVPQIVQSNGPRLLTLSPSASQKSLVPEDREIITVRPLEHRTSFGLLFASVVLAAGAALVYLFQYSNLNNGIPLTTKSPIIRSIVQNYAPTAFATLLEPMWLILSRLLCLLKPYEVLRRGKARASRSLSLKYTAIPPQLAIWRALRAKHYLLAAVCFITVSTNFLAVTLAGLLNEGLADQVMSYESEQLMLPELNNTVNVLDAGAPVSNRDHYYVALSHYGSGNPLPPWLDGKYYFLPFEIKQSPSPASVVDSSVPLTYSASTWGITAQTDCFPLPPLFPESQAKDAIVFDVDRQGKNITFFTSHLLPDGTRRVCYPGNEPTSLDSRLTMDPAQYTAQQPPGTAQQAMEILETMRTSLPLNYSQTPIDRVCTGLLISGYARITAAKPGQNRTTESSFIACRPGVQFARFNITVGPLGHVLSSNQTSPFTLDEKEVFMGQNASAAEFNREMGYSMTETLFTLNWHNASFTGDWLNHLITTKSKNAKPGTLESSRNFTLLMDPLSPLPNMTAMATTTSEVYNLLFSVVFSLNAKKMFSKSTSPVPITVEIRMPVTRLFVSLIMFRLSLAIVIIHFCTAVAYYIFRPARFLTRMPTSIASMIAYVSSSRALDDFIPSSNRAAFRSADGNEQRYGYGRFIGRDGKTHVGIERMRYVIPLESVNPEARIAGWRNMVRWRGKRREGEVKNWI